MNDEYVNGPRQAARILNALPEKQRKTLLARIQISSPETFKAISENLLSFEDLVNLTDKSVQILVRYIDQQALAIALSVAEADLREHFLQNMSARMSKIVQEDISLLPELTAAEIENAKKLIVTKADELRTTGLVQSHAPDDVWV